MSLESILKGRLRGYRPSSVIVVLGKDSPVDEPWDWVFLKTPRDLINADLRPIYRCPVYFHGEVWPEIIKTVEEKELVFIGHQAVSKRFDLSREFASYAHEAMRNMEWK
jgi:hypothetical protein